MDPRQYDALSTSYNEAVKIFAKNCNFYYMTPETYYWAFKIAGFSHFEWVKMDLYESISQEDREFWTDLIDHPNATGFIAW
jgi:hypothetical protein